MSQKDENEHDPPVKRPTAVLSYLLLIMLVFALGAIAVAGVAWFVDEFTDSGAEVVLPILLVYGVVTLVVALGALVGILSQYGLSTKGSALGLPEGSVQAVIALVLVLIFAVTSVFLLSIEITDANERLATQILTTAATLAVAVAGFYFGTRAVEAGSAAAGSAVQTAGAAVAAATGGAAVPRTVTDAMIPRAQITSYDLAPDEEPGSVKLQDLYTRMQSRKFHRIPILTPSDTVLYVVHDSTIAGFAGEEDPSSPTFTGTMADLLQDPEFGRFVVAIGFVGADATIGDARAAIRSVEGCNDVFVTASGQRGDPILGWLTNTDLAKLG